MNQDTNLRGPGTIGIEEGEDDSTTLYPTWPCNFEAMYIAFHRIDLSVYGLKSEIIISRVRWIPKCVIPWTWLVVGIEESMPFTVRNVTPCTLGAGRQSTILFCENVIDNQSTVYEDCFDQKSKKSNHPNDGGDQMCWAPPIGSQWDQWKALAKVCSTICYHQWSHNFY